MYLVFSHPMGNHGAHPDAEIKFPMGYLGTDAASKRCDALSPIPCGQMVQIVVHRVIFGYHVTSDISADVLVPAVQTSFERFDTHAVHLLFSQVLERKVKTILLTILSHASHHIEPHIIVAVEESLRTISHQLTGFDKL